MHNNWAWSMLRHGFSIATVTGASRFQAAMSLDPGFGYRG